MNYFLRYKRGVIDQTITSIIVFFGVFFLMAIFVIVSGNIGKIVGSSQRAEISINEEIGSRVLMELFLADEVEIEGKIMSVKEALDELFSIEKIVNNEVLKKLTTALRDKFDKEYSCSGVNKLYIGIRRELRDDTMRANFLGYSFVAYYLDYPLYADETDGLNICDGPCKNVPNKDSYILVFPSKAYIGENTEGVVYIKENRKC